MKFAVWLRAFIDALMRTPYVRMLEADFVEHARELKDSVEWSIRLQQQSGDRELQMRQDFKERIRDKDAVIADLKVRLAIAETDVVREQLAKQPRAPKPIPDFGGPVSFQDELAEMNLEVEETDDAV